MTIPTLRITNPHRIPSRRQPSTSKHTTTTSQHQFSRLIRMLNRTRRKETLSIITRARPNLFRSTHKVRSIINHANIPGSHHSLTTLHLSHLSNQSIRRNRRIMKPSQTNTQTRVTVHSGKRNTSLHTRHTNTIINRIPSTRPINNRTRHVIIKHSNSPTSSTTLLRNTGPNSSLFLKRIRPTYSHNVKPKRRQRPHLHHNSRTTIRTIRPNTQIETKLKTHNKHRTRAQGPVGGSSDLKGYVAFGPISTSVTHTIQPVPTNISITDAGRVFDTYIHS